MNNGIKYLDNRTIQRTHIKYKHYQVHKLFAMSFNLIRFFFSLSLTKKIEKEKEKRKNKSSHAKTKTNTNTNKHKHISIMDIIQSFFIYLNSCRTKKLLMDGRTSWKLVAVGQYSCYLVALGCR